MRTKFVAFGVLVAAFTLPGCGGGGAGGSVSGGTTGAVSTGSQGNAASIAATFSVDVNSGKVSVVSEKGTLTGSARIKPTLFTGNAIGFNSTTITDLTSQGLGAKVMSVSLTNNSGSTVGLDPNGNVTGLNVMFGAFVNTTGVVDQRSNTNVSTFAGTTSGFADGAYSVAKFFEPTASAVGSDGSVYVSDFGNNRIRKISGGYVSTLAGNGTAADLDGGPSKAEFKGPYGLAVNPVDGSIIVADFSGNTIRRVTTLGVVNTVAGTGTAGSANGAGNVATFSGPTDVTVDPSGIIYVSEAGSNRIRKITLVGLPTSAANYTVSTFAGNGTAGLVDGAGTGSEFSHPYGLTTDSSGVVYVADNYNNAIRRIDTAANVTTIAGTNVQSDLDGYGNAATFNHPFGIAYQNGALFVCEETGNRLREVMQVPGGGITSTSWLVETLAGAGSSGDVNGVGSSATFNSPLGIAASPSSSIYVADFANNQIRKVAPSTGTFPIGTPSGSTNTADPVQLSNPTGAVDNSDLGAAPYITYAGSLAPGQTDTAQPWNFVVPTGVTSFQFQVIVEANTSELIPLGIGNKIGSPNVDVRSFAGNANVGGYANGAVGNALFSTYLSTAWDASGVMYVADPENSTVRRIDLAGNVVTIAGSFHSQGSANGLGNVATFLYPDYLAVSPAGNEVFVTDSGNNEIRRIALTGSNPSNAASWTVSTIAGTTTAGYVDGNGASAGLDDPYGLCFGPGNELFVTEYNGNRIRRLDYTGGDRSAAASWNVTTVAGDDSQVAGAGGLVNAQGGVARFSAPQAIAADVIGNLYVADVANNVIRKIDRSYNVTTYAGNGTAGFTDGPGASAEFSQPVGVATDSAGYVYVADFSNSVIRRISPGQVVGTVAGTGTNGPADGAGNVAQFEYPYATMVSPAGTLYTSSAVLCNIRIIQPVQNAAAGTAKPKN